MLYFAYGSNMSKQRMLRRIPSARVVGTGYLNRWAVVFNKRSSDGSGKANLVEAEGAEAWGVLYEIELADFHRLHQLEKGYQRQTITAFQPGGDLVEAETYVSDDLTNVPVAFDWYKAYLVTGAAEASLPDWYQDYIAGLPSRPDPRRI